jgi:AAA+ ATPase superfamily predicted ATPase
LEGCKSLFDPRPKTSRADLYDREEELRSLREGLRFPITLVLGLRRSGKSSLIRVASAEDEGNIWIYLDMRRFEDSPFISYKDFVGTVEREVNSAVRRFPSLLESLRRIRGVAISGVSISFAWGGRQRLRLADLFDSLQEYGDRSSRDVVVVLDEAQELIKLRGYDLLPQIAYAYDNLKRVKFVIGGSKVRMLHRFLRREDPESPLYGRAAWEVNVGPFPEDIAKDFLRTGLREAGVRFSEVEVEEAYSTLGGIAGWLTYYGFHRTRASHMEAIGRTLEEGVTMVRAEFEAFLVGRETARRRYVEVMIRCGSGCRWSEVKRSLSAMEGREINDKEVSRLLSNLEEAGFLVKVGEIYVPPDPMIRRAFSPSSA